MCGIFAVHGYSDAARLAYLGLHALQHRGQESAGIVTSDGKQMYRQAGMGLVQDVFDREALNLLKGRNAVGHVRYTTSGSSALKNAQPLLVNTSHGPIAIGHNGNLTNAEILHDELESKGSIFQTSADSEVILHLVARSAKKDLVEAFREALHLVQGAYSLVGATRDEVFGIRDPYGVRPLAIGKMGSSYVLASETTAFGLIGAKYVRDVDPGEMVRFRAQGPIQSVRLFEPRRLAQCVFEYVYFARPDSLIYGGSTYEVRRELGRQLAREAPPPKNCDMVVPVPDSASVAAVGYAEEAGVPFEMGLIRSHYVGRTFIEPKQQIRDFGVKLKISAVPEAIRRKRIILIDDSIVRGTTSRKLVRLLKKAGVKEIHMRISSPPTTGPCHYGIDTPTKEELIASSHSIAEIKEYLGVDSLKYLSVEGMLKATKSDVKNFCTGCFTGEYRAGIPYKPEGTKC